MTAEVAEIRTSTRRWHQRVEVESPPSLPRGERSLHDPRRTVAPHALSRTRRDVDKVGEVELLAGRTEAGQEATSTRCRHHRRRKRGVMRGRSRRRNHPSPHTRVGRGRRRREIKEQIGALFAKGGFAARSVTLPGAWSSNSIRRRGARWGRTGDGGAELEGMEGEFLVFAVRTDTIGRRIRDGG